MLLDRDQKLLLSHHLYVEIVVGIDISQALWDRHRNSSVSSYYDFDNNEDDSKDSFTKPVQQQKEEMVDDEESCASFPTDVDMAEVPRDFKHIYDRLYDLDERKRMISFST